MGLMQRIRAALAPTPEAPTADFQMAGLLPSVSTEEYKGADHLYDDADNKFEVLSVFQKVNNNVTWLRVVRTAPNGVVTGNWVLAVPANTKTVGNPQLDHVGTSLTVSTAVYSMDTARISYLAFAPIPGVYVESTAPPPPPTSGDLIITGGPHPSVVGTWRRT